MPRCTVSGSRGPTSSACSSKNTRAACAHRVSRGYSARGVACVYWAVRAVGRSALTGRSRDVPAQGLRIDITAPTSSSLPRPNGPTFRVGNPASSSLPLKNVWKCATLARFESSPAEDAYGITETAWPMSRVRAERMPGRVRQRCRNGRARIPLFLSYGIADCELTIRVLKRRREADAPKVN